MDDLILNAEALLAFEGASTDLELAARLCEWIDGNVAITATDGHDLAAMIKLPSNPKHDSDEPVHVDQMLELVRSVRHTGTARPLWFM